MAPWILEALIKRLRDTGSHGRPTPDHALGAVLLILYPRDGRLNFLALERPWDMPQHPGQVGLPGGGVRNEEEAPRDAALREAEEEVGIPRHRVRVLGVLGHFPILVSGWDVVAHLGWWEGTDPVRRQEAEVEEILQVPLEGILDQHIHKFAGQTFSPREYPEYFHDQDGRSHRIWGCTGRILHHFLEEIYVPVISEASGRDPESNQA